MNLGNVTYLNDVIKIGNGGINRGNNITTQNLEYCLLSKGLIFNTHHKYFELNSVVYRGKVEEIPQELFTDAVMFSLFYKGILFTNKGQKNYIMPFTAEELGCSKNDLNVLFPEDIGTQMDLFETSPLNPLSVTEMGNKTSFSPRHHGEGKDGLPSRGEVKERQEIIQFDFREFLAQFNFSAEAHALYRAALEIFRYYHQNPEYAVDRDWNDSFYDITNAIMGKDPNNFNDLESENDTRITKVKTTKGTKGFGRNTIKYAVSGEFLPVFINFFDKRDILAQKINDELVSAGLLLWKRENIY